MYITKKVVANTKKEQSPQITRAINTLIGSNLLAAAIINNDYNCEDILMMAVMDLNENPSILTCESPKIKTTLFLLCVRLNQTKLVEALLDGGYKPGLADLERLFDEETQHWIDSSLNIIVQGSDLPLDLQKRIMEMPRS